MGGYPAGPVRLHIFRAALFTAALAASFSSIAGPSSPAAQPPPPPPTLEQENIDANVPPAEKFQKFLQRDLLAFFKEHNKRPDANGIPTEIPGEITVQYELLRQKPTPDGAAYPKYYAWVHVYADGKPIKEGAARASAVERTHFEVNPFVTKSTLLRSKPDEIGETFPADLVPAIVAKARGQD